MLKLAIREKDGHIKSLEGLLERNNKNAQKDVGKKGSNRSKIQSLNDFEEESQSSKQQLSEEISRLKE